MLEMGKIKKIAFLLSGSTLLTLGNPAKADTANTYRYVMQQMAANAMASIAYSASHNEICPKGSSMLLTRGVMKLMRIKTPGGRIVLVPEIESVDPELPSVNLHEKGKSSGIANINFGPNAWIVESRCYRKDGREIDYKKDLNDVQIKKLFPAYHSALMNTLGMFAQTFSEKRVPKNELYLRFIVRVLMLPNPHKEIFNPVSESIIVFDALKYRSLKDLDRLCSESSKKFFEHVSLAIHSYTDIKYDHKTRTIFGEPHNNRGSSPACYDLHKLDGIVSLVPIQGSKELGIKPDPQLKSVIKRLEKNMQNLPSLLK